MYILFGGGIYINHYIGVSVCVCGSAWLIHPALSPEPVFFVSGWRRLSFCLTWQKWCRETGKLASLSFLTTWVWPQQASNILSFTIMVPIIPGYAWHVTYKAAICGNICSCICVFICLCVCVRVLLGSSTRRLWMPTQTTLQTGTKTWHWPARGCSAQVTRATVQTACWPAASSTLDSTWRRSRQILRRPPFARPLLTFSKRETGSARATGEPHDKNHRDIHGAGTPSVSHEATEILSAFWFL